MTTATEAAATTATAPLIETSDLSKRYGNVLALDNLSVSLQGGVTGLVGANGAGKSTLIKILLGLLSPSGGSATLFGYDVATQGPILRQFVGYMPEHDCLPLDISATEFVAHMAQISGLSATAARERTAEVLRHVGLFEERYREIRGYSTGMKQRVKLAQALVHDPRLLMLDEPTNGLDPEGRDDMLDLIRRIGSEFEISILMSSHLLREIERVCDYLVVIDGGRLVQSNSIATFTASTQILAIEVDSNADELASRLQGRGLEVGRDNNQILIALEGEPYDIIRDEIAALGLGLLRMEQKRRQLEDLFRAQDNGAASG
jgi:ABC-2 type transport system ATP-binding protein